MTEVCLEMVSRTDVGLVREVNEDHITLLPEYGVMILADGMGGYNAGEVASELATATVGSEIVAAIRGKTVTDDRLEQAVHSANHAILDAVAENPELEGMATTIAIGLFDCGKLLFAHVGDSRIYRFREGRLKRFTQDHSVIRELIDQGMFESETEALEAGVPGNVLTRGLGIERFVEVDTGEMEVESGDVILFCSDGLTDMVSDEAIEAVLADTGKALSAGADRLLESALANGGTDNISLILATPAAVETPVSDAVQ